MRKILVLLVIAFASCKDVRIANLAKGYYYENEGFRIFYFEEDKFTIFNLRDSVKEGVSLSLKDRSITLDDKDYYVSSNDENSISLINSDHTIELKPFYYEDFEYKKLMNGAWSYNDVETNAEHHLLFEESEMKTYFKYDNEVSARKGIDYFLTGKQFNKFYSFYNGSYIIIVSYDEHYIKMLDFSDDTGFEIIKFKRQLFYKGNNSIMGKWKQVMKHPYSRLVDEFNLLHPFVKNRRIKDDFQTNLSKNIVDYKRIEFSKKSLTYYVGSGVDSTTITYKSDYSIPGHIFTSSPYMEDRLLKVIHIKNDTMILELSKPNRHRFVYTKEN